MDRPKLEPFMVYETTNGNRALVLESKLAIWKDTKNGFHTKNPGSSGDMNGEVVKIFKPLSYYISRVFIDGENHYLIWERQQIITKYFNEKGEDITNKLSEETKRNLKG